MLFPAFQPNYRQNNEPSTPAFFEPSPTPTVRPNVFNGRPIVAGPSFQQRSQDVLRETQAPVQPTSTAAPQNRQTNQPFRNQNRPQNQQQFNRAPTPQNDNFNRQPSQPQNFNRQPSQPAQNFNRQPSQQNQNFNRPNQFNQGSSVPQTRATAIPTTQQTRTPTNLPVVRAQTINAALQPRPTTSSRQPYNDDFEDNDKQEFLKTAPSSNFRPSDINSFSNTYKSEAEKSEVSKVVSTTKYYTPTIVTTPKPAPVSSTSAPRPPAPPAPAASANKDKDNSYDYAYYDDAGTFSEYDALDALGETDFSRTSQRSKSRLI